MTDKPYRAPKYHDADNTEYHLAKDVLRERADNENQIKGKGLAIEALKLISSEVEKERDEALARAEKAEKDIQDLKKIALEFGVTWDEFKGDIILGATNWGKEVQELLNRYKKAEARVKELEAELKRERNWSKYETKQVKERDKQIKALAGEKTK